MGSKFVIQQVVILGILMAVGFVGAKKDIINDEVGNGLAKILTNIALPTLIISSFNFSYSEDIINKIIIMFIYSLVINLIIIIMSKIVFIKYDKGKNAILKFGNIFSNAGFMGLPLILEFFGQEGLLYASIFMISYQSLLWSYGVSFFSKDKKVFNLKKLMNSPPLIGVVIGIMIFFLKVELPYIIERPISMLAALTSPVSMLILGEKLTKLNIRESIKDLDVYYGCFIKLIITPMVTFLFLKVINADPLLTGVLVVSQSLPTAIVLVVLAKDHEGYEDDIDFASKFTIISHLMSIITVPLIIILTGIAK